MLYTIPDKRYFTIGEVSKLCGVKPHVLRYWEQEFPELQSIDRRSRRRYYQKREVLLVLKIKGLLREDGFTISGARSKLSSPVTKAKNLDSIPASLADTVELEEILSILHGSSKPV